MISITIPTFNNLEYLKCTINSIKKNSTLNNFEILLHINGGQDGPLEDARKNYFRFTFSNENIGLSSSINKVCTIANDDYRVYAHGFSGKWN